MKRISLCVLLFFPLITQLVHAELPATVLGALKAEHVPLDSVSVFAQLVDEAKPSIAHNADAPMNPASVMKLITSYAALDLLGPAYRWQTNFYSIEAIKNNTLNSGLWVKPSGDPSLNKGNLAEITSAIRQRYGLREICCELVIDNSVYAPIVFDTSAFDNQPFRSYNAPAEPLMVNQQAVRLQFIPPAVSLDGEQKDTKVITVAYPNWAGLHIKTDVKVSTIDCIDWKSQLFFKREADVFSITGNYPASCGEKYIDLYWMNGAEYFSRLFVSAWQSAGGIWSQSACLKNNSCAAQITTQTHRQTPPQLRFASLPSTATLLYQHTSPALADVLRDMNKTSNNVIARALYLALSATDHQPASIEKSEQVIKNWLASKHLNYSELVLENGAGLSRKERISAAHLAELLVSAYHSPIMPELMASLPVLGVDGTLEKRKDNLASGRAHLKSGSLDNVRAIAGYVLDNQSRRWVVVFIANGAKAANTKPAQQALLDWVTTHP